MPGRTRAEARRRIALPGYPFQRERYWVEVPRRRPVTGHPLLSARHDSASGELSFDTELFPSDPAWLADQVEGNGAGPSARGECAPPGLFIVVGDPKQSIYRFRGAEPR